MDHFAWLKDREDPRTIPYLQEENQYSEEIMAEHASVRKELYDEMLERIVEDDQTVPYLLGDWWHYSRTAKGKAYRVYCRKYKTLDAEEEVILDENLLAEEYEYFHLEAFSLNPSQTYIAWIQDTDGSENFVLHVQNLKTKELDSQKIQGLKWSQHGEMIKLYSILRGTQHNALIKSGSEKFTLKH